MPNFQFHFDRLSFWLGFIAATLLWWVFSRIRPLFPQWGEQIRQFLLTLSQRNLAGVEEYLRRETLRRAQHQHLAAPLFSLDEILVQPWLMIPPGCQDPTVEPPAGPVAGQVIPYLPDWPELVAAFGIPRLTPLQALQSGRHIAIVGRAGSGRTVALAHLASQIARRDPEAGKYTSAVPILVHALELDTVVPENEDPVKNLIKAIAGNASVVMQPQIPRFLQSVFRDKQRRVVLLLDGLDELDAERLATATGYLAALMKRHHRLQVITTAAVDYLDGLTKMNFLPLAVTAWDQPTRVAYATRWGELWNNQLLAEVKGQEPANKIDPLMMDHWLVSETASCTPLEWTLRVWGAYAGDLSGSSLLTVLDTHITRYLPNAAYIAALEEAARQMLQMRTASLSLAELEQILSSVKVVKPVGQTGEAAEAVALAEPADPTALKEAEDTRDEADTGDAQRSPAKKQNKKTRRASGGRDSGASQGERMIRGMIEGGVLAELSNHQVRFTSPVFLGFLTGTSIAHDEAAGIASRLAKKLDWPIYPLVLQFAAACSDAPDWIYPLIDEPVPPMFRGMLTAARWLRDVPVKAEWRSNLMVGLVRLIQNESLPLSVRARMIAAFYLSHDPSTPKLLKQLLISKSPLIRQVALLGCGALGSPQLISDIIALLADPQPEVRYTAILALAAIPGEPALNAIVEVLLSGDEEIRQAAAEALARIQPDGHQVLREAAAEDDLLTRRASVFGLMQVREPWAIKELERLAVSDGQWVVRNAAAQALESGQLAAPALPKPLSTPSASPWLLAYASRLGMGILPGQPATDVLLKALSNGSPAEQTAALYYLREQADEGIIGAMYHLLYGGEEAVREPVLQALQWIAASGAEMPSPTQFGLG